ncbi:hypothetical protein THOM_1314 [Trachipleistophora hominis]|uniref:Uncharacterized protein n=1 Tax=Trachipleistophora hominis TaxID=72359 RepID=L7JW88_TRAHO|nr:hypothetical protein THOM_1314 [Trachipleistophora hominis]
MGLELLNKKGEYFIIDSDLVPKLVDEKPDELWLFIKKRSGTNDISYARMGERCLLYGKNNQLVGKKCSDIGPSVEDNGFSVHIRTGKLKELSDLMWMEDGKIVKEKNRKNVEEQVVDNESQEEAKEDYVTEKFEDGMPVSKENEDGGKGERRNGAKKRGRDDEDEGPERKKAGSRGKKRGRDDDDDEDAGPERKRAGSKGKRKSTDKSDEDTKPGRKRRRRDEDEDEDEDEEPERKKGRIRAKAGNGDEDEGDEKKPRKTTANPKKSTSDKENESPDENGENMGGQVKEAVRKLNKLVKEMEEKNRSKQKLMDDRKRKKESQRSASRERQSNLKSNAKNENEQKPEGEGPLESTANILGNAAGLAVDPTKKLNMALSAAETLKGLLSPSKNKEKE